MINFENPGTSPAVNIVVRDTLEVSRFDISSLQIMDSSHPVSARMKANVVEFIFEGINLEIGGHGNILLKVKTRDDLVVGDVVSNRADIYFDYNHPIDTGFANTTFAQLSYTMVKRTLRLWFHRTRHTAWFTFRRREQSHRYSFRRTRQAFANGINE